MEQTLNKSKPWMLPFWFMLGIMIVSFLENVFVFTVFFHGQWYSRAVVLGAMIWPSIVLIEAIIYWIIRTRIADRKFVWVHLLFSLFAFVILWALYVIILAVVFSHTGPEQYGYYLGIIQKIQLYVFWVSVLIGHIFFVMTIIFSFSKKEAFDPEADGDFLSDLPG